MTGIIIFGTKGVERKLGAGYFFCPSCKNVNPPEYSSCVSCGRARA